MAEAFAHAHGETVVKRLAERAGHKHITQGREQTGACVIQKARQMHAL
jgi:hypothetical protein